MAHDGTAHSLHHSPGTCGSTAAPDFGKHPRRGTAHTGDERRSQSQDALEKTADPGVTSGTRVVIAHVVAHHSLPFPRAASCSRIFANRLPLGATVVKGICRWSASSAAS